MLFVVSVTVMFVNSTVIGGVQSGWKVAVSTFVNSTLPFCTGSSETDETLVLFTALGCFPPLLIQRASAVMTMWTCASSPSPASLQETVKVLPDSVTVQSPTACGFPASAAGTASAAVPSRAAIGINNRRMKPPLRFSGATPALRADQEPIA